MNVQGRRIYYDTYTGDVIKITDERFGGFKLKTIEQDIETFSQLSERNRDTFDLIELEYRQYAQDFVESNSYRVNPETKTLEFSYPDPNEPEAPITYQKPLSEEIEELKIAQSETDSMLLEFMEITLLGGM